MPARKILNIGKLIGNMLHQLIILKPHYQLITVPFACVYKIGFMEIRKMPGNILEVLDKIVFYITRRNDQASLKCPANGYSFK